METFCHGNHKKPYVSALVSLKALKNNVPLKNVKRDFFMKLSDRFIKKSIVLSPHGVRTINRRWDGGCEIDKETGTVLYYGDWAKKFLKNHKIYHHETQIINTKEGALRITVNGESVTFLGSSAVLLVPGASAEVDVLRGDPLVVTHQKNPVWYEKLQPTGQHKKMFDELVEINKNLCKGYALKGKFPKTLLHNLIKIGLLQDVDDKYVKLKSLLQEEELFKELKKEEYHEKECNEVVKIFHNCKKNEFFSRESGQFKEEELSKEIVKKILDKGIIRKFLNHSKVLFWADYCNLNEFKKRLEEVDLDSFEREEVLKIWIKTNRSGYDSTGLIWEKDKVTVYSLFDKTNMWSGEKTEWVTNSTAYANGSTPFLIGVSEVSSHKYYEKPIPFKEIRVCEELHNHKHEAGLFQGEAYLVKNGKGALLTLCEGKPEVTILKKGDLALIDKGVSHCLLGVQGYYEHLVVQVPSTFQYGFLFKNVQKYDDFQINEDDILKKALEKLGNK